MIPFLELAAQHQALEEELVKVFRDALRTASFVGGSQVASFEEEFATFCKSRYCIGVNSGTDALRFSLMAAGIGPGDEVITVPNTFIATTEAISQAGALPAFIDIHERTYNMDPNKLEDYLRIRNANSKSRKRPKAVIPIDLYGQPADMDGILEIAERYDLMVIEDACQAHGAGYFSRETNRWIKAGSMGLAAAFSFYPGKNLGACGEGGAVVTNDEAIAQEVRMLRDHGQKTKYYHEKEGYNGRLDAIQAGFLRVKLKYLDEWNEKRRKCAYRYNKMLADVDNVITPHEPPWVRPVYHLYVIRTQKREELQRHLLRNDIATGLHYPVPLHLQKAYKSLGYNMGDLPLSEKMSQEILSLPMYPELEIHQQKKIVSSIKEFFSS